jgi:hypothetical protein
VTAHLRCLCYFDINFSIGANINKNLYFALEYNAFGVFHKLAVLCCVSRFIKVAIEPAVVLCQRHGLEVCK